MIEGFRVIRKDGMRRRFSGLREYEVLSQLSYTPTAYSFYFNHLRTAAQLGFSTVIKT